MEAALNRRMIKSAQKIIVPADSSKSGRRGFSKICDLQDVDMVITDDEAGPTFVKCLEEGGIEVVIS